MPGIHHLPAGQARHDRGAAFQLEVRNQGEQRLHHGDRSGAAPDEDLHPAGVRAGGDGDVGHGPTLLTASAREPPPGGGCADAGGIVARS